MTARKGRLLAGLERAAERQEKLQKAMTLNDRLLTQDAGRIGWMMWFLGVLTYIGLDLLVQLWHPNWALRLLLVLAVLTLALFVLAFSLNGFVRREVDRRKHYALVSLLTMAAEARSGRARVAPRDRLPPVAETGCSYCEAAPSIRHDRTCPAIPRTWFNA